MENSEFGPPVATLTQSLHGTVWKGLRLIVRRVSILKITGYLFVEYA